jgi:hypothetical protein
VIRFFLDFRNEEHQNFEIQIVVITM